MCRGYRISEIIYGYEQHCDDRLVPGINREFTMKQVRVYVDALFGLSDVSNQGQALWTSQRDHGQTFFGFN